MKFVNYELEHIFRNKSEMNDRPLLLFVASHNGSQIVSRVCIFFAMSMWARWEQNLTYPRMDAMKNMIALWYVV